MFSKSSRTGGRMVSRAVVMCVSNVRSPLVQIPRQDQLQHEMVRGLRKAKSYTGFDADGRAVEVDDGGDLVRLLRARIETAQGTEVVILLRRDRPILREIVGDACRRGEIQAPDSLVRIVQ